MFSKISGRTPAVVLSTHTMGYGVIKSLGIMGVPIIAVYYNNSDMGYLSKYVTMPIKSPHPETNQDDFIDLVLSIGKGMNRPLLIPTDDGTLVAASKFKDELGKYFEVACTDYSTMLKFVSKENTYQIAEKSGIPIPKTFVPESARQLTEISEKLEFPFLVKPKQSHLYHRLFGKKMVLVNNGEELKKEYYKAIHNGIECVIQEYIPGAETSGYNLNSYKFNDSQVISFTAQKIRYSEGGIGIPTCAVSVNEIEVIRNHALKLLDCLSFKGYSCIEFKFDYRDRKFKLMEMNGRHNRSTLLSLKCGINFPWIEYADLILDQKIYKDEYKTGIYWIDFCRDLQSLSKRLLKDRYSLFTFFKPYFNKKVFAEVSINDFRPAVKRFYDAFCLCIVKIKNLIKKLFDKDYGIISHGTTN